MYDVRGRNARRHSVLSRRKKGRLLWISGMTLLVIFIQLLYPKTVITPLTKLDGVSIPKLSDEEMVAKIKPYENVKIRLEMKGKIKTVTTESTAREAGLIPDLVLTKQSLVNYPLWQRFLPLSFVFRGIVGDNGVKFRVDKDAQRTYVTGRLADCAVVPKNAGLKIEQDAAVLDESKDGQACDAERVEDALKDLEIRSSGIDITISADVVKPTRSNRQVKGVIGEANKMIKSDITLTLAGKSFHIEKSELAKFASITEDAKKKNKLVFAINEDAVRTFLGEIEKNIYKVPAASKTSANGDGRALDYGETMRRLKKQVLDGDGKVEGVIVSIPAGTTLSTLYAPTKDGLQLLLDDIVASKERYGISVRFMDGTAVSSRGDVSYHPASTYKMYVAYALLKRIERGEMSWSQSSVNGTVSHCFDLMIVQSDNTCAEWFGSKIGWSTISAEVRALGLNNTSTVYGGQRSTANDETLFLIKLQNGDLLRDVERDRLLSVMKRQVFRDGIPAGVGVTVADKVGFLDGDLHDAAIVYSPQQTYAMTILTTGSSWRQIADAAGQIQVQLNRM